MPPSYFDRKLLENAAPETGEKKKSFCNGTGGFYAARVGNGKSITTRLPTKTVRRGGQSPFVIKLIANYHNNELMDNDGEEAAMELEPTASFVHIDSYHNDDDNVEVTNKKALLKTIGKEEVELQRSYSLERLELLLKTEQKITFL